MNYQTKPSKRQFSTAELARKIGDVTFAASQGPVTITHHNKPRYVMLSVEDFEKINPQKAYKAADTPDQVAEWLLPALDKIASGDFSYDEK